jgi:hypothetical protein
MACGRVASRFGSQQLERIRLARAHQPAQGHDVIPSFIQAVDVCAHGLIQFKIGQLQDVSFQERTSHVETELALELSQACVYTDLRSRLASMADVLPDQVDDLVQL